MTSHPAFGTLFVALPTPFNEQLEIDEAALAHVIGYCLAQPIDGFALLTEAGEDVVLTDEERRALIERVSAQVGGKKRLLVSISTPYTRAAVDLARFAESKGANGILVSPLLTPGMGYRALYRHFDRIANAVACPAGITVRSFNAFDVLAKEEAGTLAKHDRLSMVFAPGASAAATQSWAKRLKPTSGAVYSGCGLAFSVDATHGAVGAVCGLSALGPEHAVRLMAAIKGGDVDGLRQIERTAAPAAERLGPQRSPEDADGVKKLAMKLAKRRLDDEVMPPYASFAAIKAGLKLQGHPVKPIVRPPHERIAEGKMDKLRTLLKSSGLLT